MMKGKMQSNVTEMFDQAVESFDTALRSGVKIQEEATRWWSDMMRESESLDDMQQRMRVIMNDALPITRKNIEQYMQIFDRTYRTSLEMLKKAFEMSQSDSLATAQAKTQELWEASLAMIRSNAQSIVQLNARAMEMWADFARRDIASQAAQMAQSAARATERTTEKAADEAIRMARSAARATEKAADEAMGAADHMSKRTAAAQRTASARRTAGGRSATGRPAAGAAKAKAPRKSRK